MSQGVVAGEKPGEVELLGLIATGRDHMEPEELADRLLAGEPGIRVVDIRSKREYQAFHIRGAVNVRLQELPGYLAPFKNRDLIILYSNGMTHPAQARDSLARQGFTNVYFLTDGLQGFMERCLKPLSLRSQPVLPQGAAKINKWREYFLKGFESESSIKWKFL